MVQAFSDALRALVPAPTADEPAHLQAFREIADLLLNGVTWHIAGAPHRFTELEFYHHSPAHPDTFTHGDVMQEELARWYFHRSGGEYKGGTYKGLDIAFGRPGAPAGILIRGAQSLADGAFIDGPCMCVDHLLARAGQPSIAALVAGWGRSADAAPGSPLHITVDDVRRTADIHESPRIGLTLKRGGLAERARFLARPYRLLSEPANIKKGRAHLIIGMHRQGRDAATIARLTGSPLAQVSRTIAAYESGKSRAPADFKGDLSQSETCALLGACDAFTAL
jgi:3-methyladenine DNA glycosylase Mpg